MYCKYIVWHEKYMLHSSDTPGGLVAAIFVPLKLMLCHQIDNEFSLDCQSIIIFELILHHIFLKIGGHL